MGSIKILRRNIFVSQCRKNSYGKNTEGESFSVSFILGFEKVWIKVGRVSRFSVENFLSHSAEIFRRGTL